MTINPFVEISKKKHETISGSVRNMFMINHRIVAEADYNRIYESLFFDAGSLEELSDDEWMEIRETIVAQSATAPVGTRTAINFGDARIFRADPCEVLISNGNPNSGKKSREDFAKHDPTNILYQIANKQGRFTDNPGFIEDQGDFVVVNDAFPETIPHILVIAKGSAMTIADLSDKQWRQVMYILQDQIRAHNLTSCRIRINTGYGAMLFAQFHLHLQSKLMVEGKDPNQWFLASQ